MAALHLVTTFVNELNDVKAELTLCYLAYLLSVCQTECYVGKARIEFGLAHIRHFATLTC